MKFLFLVTGLGEAAQGTAVAAYARARGTDTRFVSTTGQCHDYIAGFGFEDILYSGELPTAQLRSHVSRVIEDYSPDAIFCCNSKTTKNMFHPESPEERPDCLIVSLDSNWLFEDMPGFFDRFFVVFPREIFQRNRNYVIDDDRVQPVGFVPSGYEFNQEEIDSARRKLGIKDEKPVFAYFGRGPTLRAFLVDTLLEAMSQVEKAGKNIKAVLVTDREVQRPNVIGIEWVASDREFALYVATSACVVSHHGMPTLAKSILSNVPVISFVPDVEGSTKRSETCEVEPFEELGLCVTLPYSASPEQLTGALEEVIFGQKGRQIKQEQVKYRVKGEATVFEEITRLLREGRPKA